jgi:hypothetical protein
LEKNKMYKKTTVFLVLALTLTFVPAFAGQFSADCANGSVHVANCTLSGGSIVAPRWWPHGSIWNVGPAITLSFNLTGPIPNQLVLKVRHTGSWGNNEFTLGSVKANGQTIVSSYIPPDHMNDYDTFSIPRAYLRQGMNTIVFSLSGGNYVWWIRSIEAVW